MHSQKVERVIEVLEKRRLDAAVLRLPENIVFLSGYWPFIGWSTMIIGRERTILLVPESEAEYAREEWRGELDLIEIGDYENATKVSEVLKDMKARNIGMEINFNTVASNPVRGEVHIPSERFRKVLNNLGFRINDISDDIYKLRSIKEREDVSKIEKAIKVTERALENTVNEIREGMRECELAAYLESSIMKQTGEVGKIVFGNVFVMSGRNAVRAGAPFNVSSGKRIERGETILMELNVCVDGYWSDLTRTWVLGRPTSEQREVYETVYEALMKALEYIREGKRGEDVWKVSWKVIDDRKLGDFSPHFLGHGIGTGFHEPIPMLMEGSNHVLKDGMTHTVEPGIYKYRMGGIRIEDIVLVEKRGCKLLSQYQRELEALYR